MVARHLQQVHPDRVQPMVPGQPIIGAQWLEQRELDITPRTNRALSESGFEVGDPLVLLESPG